MQVSRRSSGESGEQYNRPAPVTLTRVYVAAESYGFHSYIGADRLVFPWRDHLVTVWLDDRDPLALVFDTDLRIMLEMGDIGELAPLVNEWNRERLGPTLSLRVGDAGEVTVHTRSSLLVGTGLSDEQLAEAVRGAMETSLLAVTHLAASFPELALPDSSDPSEELEIHRNEQDTEAVDGPLPRDRHRRLIDDPDDDATVEELLASLPTEDEEDEDGGDGSDEPWSDHRPRSVWRRDGGASSMEQPGLFPIEPFESNEDTPPLFHLEDITDADGRTRRTRRVDGWDDFSGADGVKDVYADEEVSPTMNKHHEHHDETSPQLPEPVTVDRIRDVLMDLGVEKTQGGDEVIVAWINDVLFGFFVDNGPSYLVKGHWDPNMDPENDFLRMFLLCNDWNEASVSTKAFCHEDNDGLQVRVEFTAPVGEGLNDAQLEHNTAVAINQVLNAIDSISTDATGESAVQWP